jgi:hypothetical protein
MFSVGRLARDYRTHASRGHPPLGGGIRGETHMKPVRTLVLRATALALLLLSLTASLASADDGLLTPDSAGDSVQFLLPEDPGLE